MNVLVVKLSSLGDVVHTLPALTDAVAARGDVRFDWVVEEAFAEIPSWHPAVGRVIPVAIRRWRKRPLRDFTGAEWRSAREQLSREPYDAIIDAQGLVKSALVARLAHGRCIGLDRRSAREPLATFAYHERIPVPRQMHAVDRIRTLFAAALDYSLPESVGDFGLLARFAAARKLDPRTLWFFHGTAREEKTWPVSHWVSLCQLAVQQGYRVALPWGNADERCRAEVIAAACKTTPEEVVVMPSLRLEEIAQGLVNSGGAVAVDTGLGHLAAALDVPCVALYGPTSPALIGTYGPRQWHVQSPLPARAPAATRMQAIEPGAVWDMLAAQLAAASDRAIEM